MVGTATQDGFMYVRVFYTIGVDDYKIELLPKNRQLNNKSFKRFATAEEVRELRDALNATGKLNIIDECFIFPDRIMKPDGQVLTAHLMGLYMLHLLQLKLGM